jgi:hypothetical protein
VTFSQVYHFRLRVLTLPQSLSQQVTQLVFNGYVAFFSTEETKKKEKKNQPTYVLVNPIKSSLVE